LKNLLLGAVASVAVALAAAPAIAPTWAQVAAPPPDVVHVWGTLEENLADDLEDYGSRVEVITSEQIQNGGFTDASQALQMLVPGLTVLPKNGAFDYVSASLLGGRKQDVIWLVDGVRISNRLYTTTTPLDTIPANMIERIEVLKGGQSLFYGTSAISGAINIVTKGFTKDPQSQISIGASSDDGRHISGSTSGSVGGHSYVVFASHDEAEGFQPFRDQDYQTSATDRNRGYDVTNMGLKYGFEFSDDLKLSANYIHTDATLDFANAFLTHTAYNDRDEDILSAKVDWSMGDRFDLLVKAYYHWWDTRYTELNNSIPPGGPLDVISNKDFWGFEDYGVNLMGEYRFTNNLTLVAGLDYQNYNGEDEVFLIAPQTEDVIAPFAQVRWDLDVLSGLRIAAGGRANFPSGDGKTSVWNVSADLDIDDYFYTRGQVGTSFRLPDAYELFVADPCCEQGNANLEGEESFNVEAGFGGHGDRVRWELTAFHRELDNLIQIITVPETRPVGSRPGNFPCAGSAPGCYDTFDNAGLGVETNGAELTVQWQFTDELSTTFDWTHTDAKFDDTDLQVQDIPVDTAKVSLDWAPANQPFAAGISAIWVGELADQAQSGLGRVEHGDFAVFDLTGRWYLDPERKHKLSVRVENLFDEEYFSSIGRGFTDAADAPYLTPNLGTPQTFHVAYTFDF
jgi:vitamin B12 transporter